MNPERQQALEYLRAPADGHWRWAEAGAVLVWRDGSTIAFREEIVQILQFLSPNALPPFGAIVFLLAACRGKVPEVKDILREPDVPLPAEVGKHATVLAAARSQLRVQLAAALAELAKVEKLPPELNTGITARCLLAEAVFELAKSERHVLGSQILLGLREPVSDADLLQSPAPCASGNSIRQIHILAQGLKRQSMESLALRFRTGLDRLPQSVETALPVADQARRLIDELSRDLEWGSLARAARELMAAVALPRRLGERDQFAIGGVSDITNRGSLDRLLLSELAHDDLTLSVRVALNEALYWRHEPPRREPPGTLALLLDSSIRLWGIPRVLATATALALVARGQQQAVVSAWRADGQRVLPIDLLSRNGLTQHLGALATEAHPGEALPAFLAATEPCAHVQSVLVTHRDTLDDPDFRRALAGHPGALGFIAAVDRQGHFELHALPLVRRPALCQSDLDLAFVFAESRGQPSLPVRADGDLPAIFGSLPFPFLLPVAGRLDFWNTAEEGMTYAVMNDRRLVQFANHLRGARLLANDLPGARTLWMERVGEVLHLVKAGSGQRPARLVSFPLPDGPLRLMDLAAGEEPRSFYRYGPVLLVIRNNDIRAYSLSDGRLLSRLLNPHQWLHGRYFRGQRHIYFAAWDGESVGFEPVPLPGHVAFDKTLAVFDRKGLEGPWVFCASGNVMSTLSSAQVPVSVRGELPLARGGLRISKDGHRLAFPQPNGGWDTLLDLGTGEQKNIPKLRNSFRALDTAPLLPVWNLFRVFERIGRIRDGLALCGRKNRWRKLTLNQQGKLHIGDLPSHEESELLAKVSLAQEPKPVPGVCLLQLAEWPSGSKAFLDSRGLLHLKSHDPALPEISLVLSDGEVAGWTSDGLACGPAFFFEEARESAPDQVFARLMRFLDSL